MKLLYTFIFSLVLFLGNQTLPLASPENSLVARSSDGEETIQIFESPCDLTFPSDFPREAVKELRRAEVVLKGVKSKACWLIDPPFVIVVLENGDGGRVLMDHFHVDTDI
jgi:hypothetical protein